MPELKYNELSEALKKKLRWGEIPGRDEVVEFQLCYIPAVKQNGEMLPMYRNERVPNTDTIYDPVENKHIQIAYVLRNTGNERDPYALGEIEFKRADKAVISISGKDTTKFPLLWYLRACNYNASNPLANQPSGGFIFKELEPAKTAKQKLEEKNDLRECENYINDLDDVKVIALLGALKLPVYTEPERNTLELIEFVQKKDNRARFKGMSTDARMPVAALISKAEKAEIIRLDKSSKIWKLVETNKDITQVAPQTDNYEHLVDYFHNNTNGKALKKYIEAQLDSMKASKELVGAEKDLATADTKK